MAETSKIDELFDRIAVEEYFDHMGVDYKVTHGSSGAQLNVKECPSCGNSKWKVFINAEKGLGNCFRCDEPFGPNKLLNLISGVNSKFAAERHAEDVIREMGFRARSKRKVVSKPTREDTDVILPASFPLPHEGMNATYLEERDIDGEHAKYFGLRYCENGLFAYKRDGQAAFQDYKNRIIIPVYNLKGELVTFQGRDITGTAERKYLFPSGLAGTGKFLLNGHNAIGKKHVAMGEGFFDVAAIARAFEADPAMRDIGVIGSFGKHLSGGSKEDVDQLSALRRMRDAGLEEVTIMWDGEKQALKAAATKAAPMLVGIGLKVKISILPLGCDPAEITGDQVRFSYKNALSYSRAKALSIINAL